MNVKSYKTDFQPTTTTTAAPSAPCNFKFLPQISECSQYVQVINDCLVEITIPVNSSGPHMIGVAGGSGKPFPVDAQVKFILKVLSFDTFPNKCHLPSGSNT